MPARKALVLLAGALTLVGLTSAITYAATTTSATVSACRSTHGRLALLTAKGKCPRGFRKITLNERGPAGPRGATGRTGARGPAGPVAVSFYTFTASTSTPAEATAVTFGGVGVRIGASCTANSVTNVFIIDPTGTGGDITLDGALTLEALGTTAGGSIVVNGSPQMTLMEGTHVVGGAMDAGQNNVADVQLSGGEGNLQLILQRGGRTLTLNGIVAQFPNGCEVLLQAVPSA